MAQVYTVNIFRGTVAAGGVISGISAPPGKVWVIRDIEYAERDPTLDNLVVAAIDTTLFWGVSTPGTSGAASSVHWEGRVVLEGINAMTINNDGAGDVDITITGYELTLP